MIINLLFNARAPRRQVVKLGGAAVFSFFLSEVGKNVVAGTVLCLDIDFPHVQTDKSDGYEDYSPDEPYGEYQRRPSLYGTPVEQRDKYVDAYCHRYKHKYPPKDHYTIDWRDRERCDAVECEPEHLAQCVFGLPGLSRCPNLIDRG